METEFGLPPQLPKVPGSLEESYKGGAIFLDQEARIELAKVALEQLKIIGDQADEEGASSEEKGTRKNKFIKAISALFAKLDADESYYCTLWEKEEELLEAKRVYTEIIGLESDEGQVAAFKYKLKNIELEINHVSSEIKRMGIRAGIVTDNAEDLSKGMSETMSTRHKFGQIMLELLGLKP